MLGKTLLLSAVLALIGLSCFCIYGQQHVTGPQIAATTVENSVVLTAQSFRPRERVDVIVYGQNLYITTDIVLARWTAFADLKGRVRTTWMPSAATGLVTISMVGQSSGTTTSTRLTAGNMPTSHTFDLDQCRNGTPDVPLQCAGASWVNGNLNATQAHYMEGESVPYRLMFQNMDTAITHTLTLEFDSTAGGHHSLDYLTSFDRTELNAEPCSGITGCDPLVHSHIDIPIDPEVTAGQDGILGTTDDIVQAPGQFALFGGTITGITGYTVTGSPVGNSSTSLTVTFTTTLTNPVLAFGAHIARRDDWGAGNSAIAINGSPFHMRILDSDGEGGGNQDRGVASDAVYYPGMIAIQEDSSPISFDADFWYDAYGPNMSGFWLDDDGLPGTHHPDTDVFAGLTRFGSANPYTFVQTGTVTNYQLSNLTCTSDPRGGAGTNNNSISIALGQVDVTLEEGELVTCTYLNTLIPTAAQVALSGRVMTADGRGIRSARVTFIGPGGTAASSLTNSFGYYTVDKLDSGTTYIVTATGRSYTFTPQTLFVTDAMTNVNFVAVR